MYAKGAPTGSLCFYSDLFIHYLFNKKKNYHHFAVYSSYLATLASSPQNAAPSSTLLCMNKRLAFPCVSLPLVAFQLYVVCVCVVVYLLSCFCNWQSVYLPCCHYLATTDVVCLLHCSIIYFASLHRLAS